LVIAAGALNNWSVDASKKTVDDPWVRGEVLLVNLGHASLFFVAAHISVKFGKVDGSFLVLQRADQVHEKFMGVVLHHGIELFADQILEACRIQNFLIFAFALKYVIKKLTHAFGVIIRIAGSSIVVESFEPLVEVIISELRDR
jgi:hypothetical protein